MRHPSSTEMLRHVWLGWTCQKSVGGTVTSWENSILKGAEVTALVTALFLLQRAEIHSILGNGI